MSDESADPGITAAERASHIRTMKDVAAAFSNHP
jgi:hypothetical protein